MEAVEGRPFSKPQGQLPVHGISDKLVKLLLVSEA